MSIRITGLQEVATLQSGDFVAVDNTTTGTHKFDATKLGAGVEANLAPTYSSAATYNIGDFCMYNGVLYKCTTAITSPENWTASHWTQTSAGVALADKVDKVSGKGLSENDFTDALKTKLDGIQAGAEANVQADWAQTNTSADDYIKNKPTDATTTTAGLMSAEDKVKLNGIEAGAEVNVQADWNETDSSADDYIKNKPSTATESTNGLMSSADKAKLDGIASGAEVNVQADWAQTNTSAEDYIKNKPTAATESTTGLMSAADKAKLDSIEQGAEVNVQADWAQTNMSADDYIKNKPVDATESVGGLMSAEDKAKLNGIEDGAQVNVIDGVKVDGVALTPDANKDVDIVGKANQASIAEQYSTTATYVYDDYVIYNNTLYRCIADTSGAWDANDWEAVNIGDELEHKANIDGAYDDMTVGNAEQLVSSVAINEHQPYNFRPSGGSVDIGDRKTEEIVGGTIAWNQLASGSWRSSHTINNVTYTPNDDGTFTLNGTANANDYWGITPYPPISKVGHKYIIWDANKQGSSTTFGLCFDSNTIVAYGDVAKIVNCTSAGQTVGYAYKSGTQIDNKKIKPVFIDLTAMFGTEIADYIYNLEQANEGAGVARFRKYFPKPYYAYDAGSLQSVNLRSGVMTELNQWDEEWELGTIDSATGANATSSTQIRSKNKIQVLPSTTYYVNAPYGLDLYAYDKSGGYLGQIGTTTNNATFDTLNGCYQIAFASVTGHTTYGNDICINLSWDGEYDGVYEPYITHTYQYDPDLELRGIPKLDENNYLTYDGDVYESDGAVTRKYGIVDLGTLEWDYYTEGIVSPYFQAPPISNSALGAKGICAKYIKSAVSSSNTNNKVWTILNSSGHIRIRDTSYSNAATFKTAMSGVYLVYELATPTTEQAEPYTNPQIVNDFGTESFIDSLVEQGTRDVSIPVGHNTKYLANLKAKLEMAPNSPDGDGKYIVQQTDGMNYYVNFEPEIANKANVDGAYEDMTVGNAEQLLASVYTEDQIPYNFRQSGGGISVGDREIDKVVGGTVAWNQLVVDDSVTSDSDGITYTNNSDGSWTLDGTATAKTWKYINTSSNRINTTDNHRYLLCGMPNNNTKLFWRMINDDTTGTSDESDTGHGIILTKGAGHYRLGIGVYNGETVSNVKVIPQFFDLTVMFGSTIADYIYTLETTNAGDGVAWFRNLFPEPYYVYNAGSLQSVNTSAHEMVGFNQWDEEWELGKFDSSGQETSSTTQIRSKNYNPVIPNTAYYVYIPYTSNVNGFAGCYFYTKDKEYINNQGVKANGASITSPSNAYYMRFTVSNMYGTTYKHDICINISHNGSRNGEYEPYVKHTYPLDSSLTLRGIPKLDSSNRLYFDGDTYESDGTVTRRTVLLNLGSISYWNKRTLNGHTVFYSEDYGLFATYDGLVNNSAYIITTISPGSAVDKTIGLRSFYWDSHPRIYVCDDSYSDLTSAGFKTAINGVYILGLSPTTTTETADPFQNPQIVDDWGTEEYVDYAYTQGTRDVAVPVGHYTEYLPNLRDKLQALPDAAGSNGTYVIEQTGGQMALTPLTTPKEIPDAPTSTDGTFALQATVSSGNVTYAWVSVT